ncbi:hypothetical protein AAC387_Pa07g1347 [Persea americana]
MMQPFTHLCFSILLSPFLTCFTQSLRFHLLPINRRSPFHFRLSLLCKSEKRADSSPSTPFSLLTAPHTTGLFSNVHTAHQILLHMKEVCTASTITLSSSRQRGISASLANMNLLES